jgi:YHS domain-containing protein
MSLEGKKTQSSGKTEMYHGETFLFCSDKCRKKFQEDPARYANEKLGSSTSTLRESRRDDD